MWQRPPLAVLLLGRCDAYAEPALLRMVITLRSCGFQLDFGTMKHYKGPATRLMFLPGLVRRACHLMVQPARCREHMRAPVHVSGGMPLGMHTTVQAANLPSLPTKCG